VSGTPKDSGKVRKTIACPKDPFEYCDFYIQGYKDQVPLLSLAKAHEAAGSTTATISGEVKDRHYMGDEESEKRCTVHVREKTQTRFFCPAPRRRTTGTGRTRGQVLVHQRGQGLPHPHHPPDLLQREDDDVKTLTGRCAIMQFGTVYVFKDQDAVAKLYPRDGDQEYPEARRCVVFKTGDEEPVCNASEAEDPSPNCPALILASDAKDLFPSLRSTRLWWSATAATSSILRTRTPAPSRAPAPSAGAAASARGPSPARSRASGRSQRPKSAERPSTSW